MKYIETLREGENIKSIYLVKQKISAVTKTGKDYENITLQDKTGQLDAKIWNPNAAGIDEFEVLDYIEVTGTVNSFNGQLQLHIDRARKCREGEYIESDYLPVSKRDIEEMYKELLGYIKSISNPQIKKLCELFFVEDAEFVKSFKKSSAAKSVHHAFVGGLLEHTLGVTKLVSIYADIYSMLRKDLLVASAMFHDMGKTKEFSLFPQNDYTDDGQLLGHIVMGIQMLDEKIKLIPDFNADIARELKHCILTHHGEYEYGSPKKPATAEAMALHFADNLDAKMETLKEMFEVPNENEWLGYNKFFETNIKRSTEV